MSVERHVMKECYGGKMVFILTLRKNFHMRGAMLWKSAMGGKTCFYSNIDEKLPHGGHHGGAPWERHVLEVP